MATRSSPLPLITLVGIASLILGCSGPTPSAAPGNAGMISTQKTPAPSACIKDGAAKAIGTIVVYRCRETDPMSGKCVDAMCEGCIDKGRWSTPFECVPS